MNKRSYKMSHQHNNNRRIYVVADGCEARQYIIEDVYLLM